MVFNSNKMGIGKFKLIKKLLKFAGNGINKIANSKVVKKLIEPVSAVAGLIPVVGSVVEKAIDNIPQNVGGFGTLLSDIGEGKNVLQSLSNYEQNTSFVGRPFNGIAIGGSLLNKIINKNDNSSSVNREKINNTFEQLRIQNAKN